MLEFISKLPAPLATAALVIAAVGFLLDKLGAFMLKLRGANGRAERIESANSDPPRGNGNGASPATYRTIGERIDDLKDHFDARFDELGERLTAVELDAKQHGTAIARLEGLDEGRQDVAGKTGPHRTR